jgi:serine/threonine protein kinase
MFCPHGRVKHPSSWILSTKRRTEQYANDSFKRFIASIIQTKRLIYWGIGIKDFALTTLLSDDLKSIHQRVGSPGHFWIKSNPTPEDYEHARAYNVKIIPYTVGPDNIHNIRSVVAETLRIPPRDSVAQYRVENRKVDWSTFPSDEVLSKHAPEEIRGFMDAAYDQILYDNKENGVGKAIEFTKKYPRSTHQSWMVSEQDGLNIYHGQRISGEIDGGAFGTVYSASDPVDGTPYAIKILRRELISNKDFIDAFRRGVSAQQMLTRSSVPGMVRLKDSKSFPPSIIMEYIEGITLTEFIGGAHYRDFAEISEVLSKTCAIVSSAHAHPETILHRDLKPNNIMLKEFWGKRDEYEVVILDFDLSWYRGAVGMSLLPGAKLQGYASPELTGNKEAGTTTRNVSVDVYSLGMVIYYAFTLTEPYPNMTLATSFTEDTANRISVAHRKLNRWVTRYLSVLITRMTKFKQSERISMEVAKKCLGEVNAYLNNGTMDIGGDLILCSLESDLLSESVVKSISSSPAVHMRCGEVEVHIKRIDTDGDIQIEVQIIATAGNKVDRSNTEKYLTGWKERAISKLSGDNIFSYLQGSVTLGQTVVAAHLSRRSCNATSITAASKRIKEAVFAMMGQ